MKMALYLHCQKQEHPLYSLPNVFFYYYYDYSFLLLLFQVERPSSCTKNSSHFWSPRYKKKVLGWRNNYVKLLKKKAEKWWFKSVNKGGSSL